MLIRTKRYSLTLLEVMIALSLAAILMSALMTTYYQASKKRIAAQELKKKQFVGRADEAEARPSFC